MLQNIIHGFYFSPAESSAVVCDPGELRWAGRAGRTAALPPAPPGGRSHPAGSESHQSGIICAAVSPPRPLRTPGIHSRSAGHPTSHLTNQQGLKILGVAGVALEHGSCFLIGRSILGLAS